MPRPFHTLCPALGRTSARRWLLPVLLLSLCAGLTLVAPAPLVRAAEVTRLVSAGEDDNPYDLNVFLAFRHLTRQATLLREATSPTGGVERQRDQVFQQTRNILDILLAAGLLPDVGLYVHLPLVLSDNRWLTFDGTNASTSSLLRDGILPGFGQDSYGFDAANGEPFASPSDKTFQGPTRKGLEYLAFGLTWGMFNQRRVPSEPTWLVGLEARIDVASSMRYDPARPLANTAVGPGYHQLLAHTTVSRRFGPVEPYLGGWYMFPIKTATSPFDKQGLGANAFSDPQHQARLMVGSEATVWERPGMQQAIRLELRLHMETRFLGLARGELWEPLTGSSACPETSSACRPGLDDRDLDGDGAADPNPGITRSPSYGIFGGDVGFVVQGGPYVRFRGLFGLTFEQSRFLTDGRSGYGLYDAPGRRFYVKDAYGVHVLLDGALLF